MKGTVYQGSLSRIRSSHRPACVNRVISPIGLEPGSLRANFLRNWLDLVELDPHGLVRQLLVVERITNRAAGQIVCYLWARWYEKASYIVFGAKHLLARTEL